MALLANVDVRTVRNAISAGDLIAYKTELGQFVENASARTWLRDRRGFKPTVMHVNSLDSLDDVSTPGEFGAFLAQQRKRIGLDEKGGQLVPFHPSVTALALAQIEAGVFNLPIDTVFPIADFYQLERKAFLSCVMRVFFGEQLSTLREALLARKGDR